MTDETEQVGLGKVIYSVDDKATHREERLDQAEIREADEESFPASDPPGFAGGACAETEQTE
jgi:hypothetical protein